MHEPSGLTLILVRHGETEWNREDRVQGQSDVPLSAAGRRQAQTLAAALTGRGVVPAAVYASTLSRALETARIIAAPFDLDVSAEPRLRERHSGAAEGMRRAEVRHRFGARVHGGLVNIDSVPGVEPVPELVQRVDTALTDIAARHGGRTVVAVSHGGAIANWLQARLGLEQRPVVPTGGTVTVRCQAPDSWVLVAADSQVAWAHTSGEEGRH